MTSAGSHLAVPDVTDLTRVIAIDGPAGSGKTTVARLTAQALGWRFVDTGATYRAVTLAVLRRGVPLEDTAAVAAVAADVDLELSVDPRAARVSLGGCDVSGEIRGPEVTAAVSAVAAVPAVRRRLVELQRALIGTGGAVVEGRDIATVVAPRARLKVYLDAREEVRARRRAAEVHALGAEPTEAARDSAAREVSAQPREARQEAVEPEEVHAVQVALQARDALDGKTNALVASEGAVHLDTSDLLLEEVVSAVVALARQAGLTEEHP